MGMLGDVDSPGLPVSLTPEDRIIVREENPVSNLLPNHWLSLTIHLSWLGTTLPEWPMRRVSITTLHYRRILGNSNLHCDSDREPGANCLFNEDCNCKSKTFHNSLLYLRISQGGINCNSSFVPGVPGLCGGYQAYMNDSEASDGLDFGRDYCLSGEFPCVVQESP